MVHILVDIIFLPFLRRFNFFTYMYLSNRIYFQKLDPFFHGKKVTNAYRTTMSLPNESHSLR